MISERPAEVADRAVPGHWEGDLILGAENGSAIGTLVERTTRYAAAAASGRPATTAPNRSVTPMIAAMRGLPTGLRRSMTWDQGIELTRHPEITFALNIADLLL